MKELSITEQAAAKVIMTYITGNSQSPKVEVLGAHAYKEFYIAVLLGSEGILTAMYDLSESSVSTHIARGKKCLRFCLKLIKEYESNSKTN